MELSAFRPNQDLIASIVTENIILSSTAPQKKRRENSRLVC